MPSKLSTQHPEQGIRVMLFNNFESFSPAGVKIKEIGEVVLTCREIKRMYGLEYEQLTSE